MSHQAGLPQSASSALGSPTVSIRQNLLGKTYCCKIFEFSFLF